MVFVLLFALVFVWYGIKFVQFGWNQTSELADLPMPWIFVAWPLTGLTWLLFGFERLRADLRIVIDGPGPGSGAPPHATSAPGAPYDAAPGIRHDRRRAHAGGRACGCSARSSC